MRKCLSQLLDISETDTKIKGSDGVLGKEDCTLYVGNSGTTSWFLISALTLLKPGIKVKMEGDIWIEERPMLDIIKPLWELGLIKFEFLKN